MPDSGHNSGDNTDNGRATLGLLILAGVGAGTLAGALLGLFLARRPRTPADADGKTVDELKRRAEQILRELSQTAGAESP